MQTVKENEIGHSNKELEQAKSARKIHGMIGHPSSKDHEATVQLNLIKSCPISLDDVK